MRFDSWKQPGYLRGLAAGISLIFLIIGGFLVYRLETDARGAGSGPVSILATPALASAGQLGHAFAEVARRVEPAVVNINTEQLVRVAPDPFGEFFGLRPHNQKLSSLGSGFIVDPQGYILTNYHVVKKATRIRVKLNDDRVLDAKVVGADPSTDLAVVSIRASGLPYLRLADSGKVDVGDWVLAFGSPFGLEKTMTAGIISAKGRVIGTGPYDDFLQTDAAINPGNSGGPLVDLQGEVVGINTLIASDSGGWQGVGFAIPSTMASGVYHQLTSAGKVSRGWLGVGLEEITRQQARSLGLDEPKGALVTEVKGGSPAERAGLRPGDVILGFNGHELRSPRDLSLAIADAQPGTPFQLTASRNGRKFSVDVRLGERPAELAER